MPGWTGITGRLHRHAGEGSAQQFGDANHRSTWEVGKWQGLEIINSCYFGLRAVVIYPSFLRKIKVLVFFLGGSDEPCCEVVVLVP